MFKKSHMYSRRIGDDACYRRVRNIGKLSVIRFALFSELTMILTILLIPVYVVLLIWNDWPKWLPLVPGFIAIVLVYTAELLKRGVECPECKYRPSLNRDGKSVKADILDDRLLKLESCPKCRNVNG